MIIFNRIVFICISCNKLTAQKYEGRDIDMCASCVDRWMKQIHIQTMDKLRRSGFPEDVINKIEKYQMGDQGKK